LGLGCEDSRGLDGIRDVGVVGVGVTEPRVEQVLFRGGPQRVGRGEPVVYDSAGCAVHRDRAVLQGLDQGRRGSRVGMVGVQGSLRRAQAPQPRMVLPSRAVQWICLHVHPRRLHRRLRVDEEIDGRRGMIVEPQAVGVEPNAGELIREQRAGEGPHEIAPCRIAYHRIPDFPAEAVSGIRRSHRQQGQEKAFIRVVVDRGRHLDAAHRFAGILAGSLRVIQQVAAPLAAVVPRLVRLPAQVKLVRGGVQQETEIDSPVNLFGQLPNLGFHWVAGIIEILPSRDDSGEHQAGVDGAQLDRVLGLVLRGLHEVEVLLPQPVDAQEMIEEALVANRAHAFGALRVVPQHAQQVQNAIRCVRARQVSLLGIDHVGGQLETGPADRHQIGERGPVLDHRPRPRVRRGPIDEVLRTCGPHQIEERFFKVRIQTQARRIGRGRDVRIAPVGVDQYQIVHEELCRVRIDNSGADVDPLDDQRTQRDLTPVEPRRIAITGQRVVEPGRHSDRNRFPAAGGRMDRAPREHVESRLVLQLDLDRDRLGRQELRVHLHAVDAPALHRSKAAIDVRHVQVVAGKRRRGRGLLAAAVQRHQRVGQAEQRSEHAGKRLGGRSAEIEVQLQASAGHAAGLGRQAHVHRPRRGFDGARIARKVVVAEVRLGHLVVPVVNDKRHAVGLLREFQLGKQGIDFCRGEIGPGCRADVQPRVVDGAQRVVEQRISAGRHDAGAVAVRMACSRLLQLTDQAFVHGLVPPQPRGHGGLRGSFQPDDIRRGLIAVGQPAQRAVADLQTVLDPVRDSPPVDLLGILGEPRQRQQRPRLGVQRHGIGIDRVAGPGPRPELAADSVKHVHHKIAGVRGPAHKGRFAGVVLQRQQDGDAAVQGE